MRFHLKKSVQLKTQRRCDVFGCERRERRRLDTLMWTRRWNAANKRANDTVKHSKRAIQNAQEKKRRLKKADAHCQHTVKSEAAMLDS